MSSRGPRQILSGLDGLITQAGRITAYTRTVKTCLPTPLTDHVMAANLRDEVLVLHVDSSAWSTRLRYLAPTLLRELRECHRLAVRSLEVRVRPSFPTPPKPTRRTQLSPLAATVIAQSAEHMPDPGLRAALQRLATRGKQD